VIRVEQWRYGYRQDDVFFRNLDDAARHAYAGSVEHTVYVERAWSGDKLYTRWELLERGEQLATQDD